MNDTTDQTIGIDAIMELTGASKVAKAYAFLHASFKKTEGTGSPVKHAVDGLVPFIGAYLDTIPAQRVDVTTMQAFLKDTFGFSIPLYALLAARETLRTFGSVEYRKAAKDYYAKPAIRNFGVVRKEIETDFDIVVVDLEKYARSLEYTTRPPSGTWGDALISFLRGQSDKSEIERMKIKGGLVNPARAERVIIGHFLKHLHDSNYLAFGKVLRIFMGVLIEGFISSVAAVSTQFVGKPAVIFYDTSVLTRLLKCSGRLLHAATLEMTKYLQSLGFTIYYFSGNEAEIAAILRAINAAKESGDEFEGETADALSRGEISSSELKKLEINFPSSLKDDYHIFRGDEFEKADQNISRFPFSEDNFSEYLLTEAKKTTRAYQFSPKNRRNDASYLGHVMRLRAGNKTSDLFRCGYLFVTTNKFLTKASRDYLIDRKVIQPPHTPPILNVEQVATIAWLLKDKKLEQEKAGRELLANCFAAVRPDSKWFKHFREHMEGVVGPLEQFAADASNAIALDAARQIASEQSFGSFEVVEQLNMAEILNQGKLQAEEFIAQKDAAAADHAKQAALDEAGHEKAKAIQEAAEMARRNVLSEINEAQRRQAYKSRSGKFICENKAFVA